jgi:hypothetical protein
MMTEDEKTEEKRKSWRRVERIIERKSKERDGPEG